MSNPFKDLKEMHRKFNIDSDGCKPGALTKEEYLFRIGAMFEELWEYVEKVFDLDSMEGPEDEDTSPDHFRQIIVETLSNLDLRKDVNNDKILAEQFDALIDLTVFTLGTVERQAFPFDKGWQEVMRANMAKELAGEAENSKRGFKADLVKPDGWTPPNLYQFTARPKGIIILEGPDGTGKTSLGDMLCDRYGAWYTHQTWSKELEKVMDRYHKTCIEAAIERSKDSLVIIDRTWISEFIYADVFREGTQYPNLADECYAMLSQADVDPLYIFCMPMSDETEKRYLESFENLKTEREEMYTTMASCLSAFKSFVYGCDDGGYKFNLKKNKTNFYAEGLWRYTDSGLKLLDGLMYDRFLDPQYHNLIKHIDEYVWLEYNANDQN